jgi:chromosomal replication initiator protein
MTANPPELVRSDEAASLWKSVLHAPSPRLATSTRDALLEHTRCLERTATELRVAIDARELETWLRGGQLGALETALAALTDGASALALIPVDDVSALRGDPSYTFATFVASPANTAVRSSVLAFARDARLGNGAALAVHGGTSSGKTHLLRALHSALAESLGAGAIVCCSAEQLSLELIRALWGDAVDAFRERLMSASALIVDDVDSLAGRDATQEELAQAIAALAARGVPVAVSLARPVERSSGLSDPLRTQLARFAPLEVRAPEWETRVAIVHARARRWRVEPSAPVAAFLASRLRAHLGRLDALLTRLMTRSSAGNALADLEVVKQLLTAAADRAVASSPDEVLHAVSHHFNLRVRDLRSQSRASRVTTPRQVAMYLMRRHCNLSYPEIGRRFGRHHTTALHSDRVVQEQLADNAGLRAAIVLIEKELLRNSEAGG